MHTPARITELPTELLLAIFQSLLTCNHNPKKDYMCKCWCLNVMTAATVCSSWYSILSRDIILRKEAYPNRIALFQWPEMLINDMGPERTYPYLKRTLAILEDSKKYNLDLHLQVQYLVIDFAMLDNLQYQQQTDSRDIHYKSYTGNTIQVLNTCPNIQRLGIMYDTKFASLVEQGTALLENIQQLSAFAQQQKEKNIKQLDLIGYSPIQRCPCCAGEGWDHLLIPLIDTLTLERLVLRHVVSTSSICEAFARQTSLTRLTLFRSIMTMPSDTKHPLPIAQRPTSIDRIPHKVWRQIRHLDILENSEDSSIWPIRYLDKIAERIETLDRFSLVFGTSEENMQCLENEGNMFLDNMTVIPENNRFGTALIRLISSSSESLTQMSLVNVPNIESGRVWLK